MKQFIKKIIKTFPGGIFTISAFRWAIFLATHLLTRIRSTFSSHSLADPETVYWIDTDRIEFHTNYIKTNENHEKDFEDRVFKHFCNKGRVVGGDWDISSYKFSEMKVYKALKKRIIEGGAWEETDFYKEVVRKINAGRVLWGCANEGQFTERCHYLDMLIQSMKRHGYLLNRNTDNGYIGLQSDDQEVPISNNDEIYVNIGRDGKYLFQDGRHRLAIAKILGIGKVPVKVLVRHKKWVELRDFLVAMTKSERGATRVAALYQPAIHPDLMDIPYAHGCEDRFRLISNHLDVENDKKKTLLDIGANLGYFCHKFEEREYDCIAIEMMPDIAWAADKIRAAEGKKFKVLTGDLFDKFKKNQVGRSRFDLVLALNIFHHFLKTKESFLRFKEWLGKIETKAMIFEPHCYDEDQMKSAFVNFHNEEFISFILQNTSLKNSKLIGEVSDGRKIYILYR